MSEKAFSVTAADCSWQYFRVGGNGGQHRDKTSSGCRVTHPPSGAIGESREHRSQLQNRHAAFTRMAEHWKFKVWISQQLKQETPEQWVEKQMVEGNLRVEVRDSGRWEVSE